MQILLLASQIMASQMIGCWAGSAQVQLLTQPIESCSEMRLELRVEGAHFRMINHGLDCERDFALPWDQKSFELRGEEVWGGRRTPGIIGWLKPTELVIAEELNMFTWTEWKGVLQSDLISEQPTLHWQEIMTNRDRVFWNLRGELLPIACNAFEGKLLRGNSFESNL
jgi:hypothetical protein